MKKYVLFVLSAALFFARCQKPVTKEDPLTGKWLWIKSAGGVNGNQIITPSDPPPAGGYKMLTIFNETQYFLDRARNNFMKLRYTTGITTDIVSGQKVQEIIFYDEYDAPGIPQTFITEGNQLIIKDNIREGYTHYYTRIY